jgi:hypothetical protein
MYDKTVVVRRRAKAVGGRRLDSSRSKGLA